MNFIEYFKSVVLKSTQSKLYDVKEEYNSKEGMTGFFEKTIKDIKAKTITFDGLDYDRIEEYAKRDENDNECEFRDDVATSMIKEQFAMLMEMEAATEFPGEVRKFKFAEYLGGSIYGVSLDSYKSFDQLLSARTKSSEPSKKATEEPNDSMEESLKEEKEKEIENQSQPSKPVSQPIKKATNNNESMDESFDKKDDELEDKGTNKYEPISQPIKKVTDNDKSMDESFDKKDDELEDEETNKYEQISKPIEKVSENNNEPMEESVEGEEKTDNTVEEKNEVEYPDKYNVDVGNEEVKKPIEKPFDAVEYYKEHFTCDGNMLHFKEGINITKEVNNFLDVLADNTKNKKPINGLTMYYPYMIRAIESGDVNEIRNKMDLTLQTLLNDYARHSIVFDKSNDAVFSISELKDGKILGQSLDKLVILMNQSRPEGVEEYKIINMPKFGQAELDIQENNEAQEQQSKQENNDNQEEQVKEEDNNEIEDQFDKEYDNDNQEEQLSVQDKDEENDIQEEKENEVVNNGELTFSEPVKESDVIPLSIPVIPTDKESSSFVPFVTSTPVVEVKQHSVPIPLSVPVTEPIQPSVPITESNKQPTNNTKTEKTQPIYQNNTGFSKNNLEDLLAELNKMDVSAIRGSFYQMLGIVKWSELEIIDSSVPKATIRKIDNDSWIMGNKLSKENTLFGMICYKAVKEKYDSRGFFGKIWGYISGSSKQERNAIAHFKYFLNSTGIETSALKENSKSIDTITDYVSRLDSEGFFKEDEQDIKRSVAEENQKKEEVNMRKSMSIDMENSKEYPSAEKEESIQQSKGLSQSQLSDDGSSIEDSEMETEQVSKKI